ncbi:MAG: peroxiredoxin [Caulobacteraceae bacterium]
MIKHLGLAAAGASLLLAGPSFAALQPGAVAPEFSASGFKGGAPIHFDLKAALRKGPVVLYFFPAPETAGCDLEAHLFADATDKFHSEGATVIGVTAGNLDKLALFSKETDHCSGKFPVAADPTLAISRSYDATLDMPNAPKWSNRTSYVIAPDDKILLAYSNLNPNDHVEKTLAAVEAWRAKHPK